MQTSLAVSDTPILIDQVAKAIVYRRLSAPAIFLLEMIKPLVSMFREGGVLVAPLFLFLVGTKLFKATLALMDNQQSIESLIKKIEYLEQQEISPKGISEEEASGS